MHHPSSQTRTWAPRDGREEPCASEGADSTLCVHAKQRGTETYTGLWAEQGPHVSKASPSTPPFAEDRRVRLAMSLMLHVGHEGSDGDGHTPRHVAKHRVFGLEVGLDVVAGHRAAGGARFEPVSPDERQLVLDSRLEKQHPPGCPERVAAGEEGDKTPWLQVQVRCDVEQQIIGH